MARKQAAQEKDKGRVLGMVFMGCDAEVAARSVGWTEKQFAEQLARDPVFAQDLALNEGNAELHHMKTVHTAAKEPKNWRASAWWIARRTARRRDDKLAGAISISAIQQFLEDLVDIVFQEVTDEECCDRLVARVLSMANQIDRENVSAMLGAVSPTEAVDGAR